MSNKMWGKPDKPALSSMLSTAELSQRRSRPLLMGFSTKEEFPEILL